MNTSSLREISLGIQAPPKPRLAAWRTVLGAGIAAATLDLTYASLFYWFYRGVSPVRVLHTIASGIYGQDSYTGGALTAGVGFVAHYVILIVAAWWYFLASRHLKVLRDRAIVCGLLYGVAIYCTMNFVVIPLSNAPFAGSAFNITITFARATDFCSHLILGLIIALSIRAYWRKAAWNEPDAWSGSPFSARAR